MSAKSSKFVFDVECVAYDGKQFLFGPRWSTAMGTPFIAELTGCSAEESEFTFKSLQLTNSGTEYEPSFKVTICERSGDLSTDRQLSPEVAELVFNFVRALRLVQAGVAVIRGFRD
ncbi:hypothetical protein [Burkholderia phage BCSR129]|nr:hypothetical protein [Burkholderia phage BCSR129]